MVQLGGRHWELSPGYAKKHLHFERRVLPLCLYCHANHAENVAGTMEVMLKYCEGFM